MLAATLALVTPDPVSGALLRFALARTGYRSEFPACELLICELTAECLGGLGKGPHRLPVDISAYTISWGHPAVKVIFREDALPFGYGRASSCLHRGERGRGILRSLAQSAI